MRGTSYPILKKNFPRKRQPGVSVERKPASSSVGMFDTVGGNRLLTEPELVSFPFRPYELFSQLCSPLSLLPWVSTNKQEPVIGPVCGIGYEEVASKPVSADSQR